MRSSVPVLKTSSSNFGSWPVPNSASGETRNGRQHLAIAVLPGVDVEHEGGEGPLEPRSRARQQREASSGNLRGALEVQDPECLAELPVRPGLEVEAPGLSPSSRLGVRLLVGADGDALVREIRQRFQHPLDRAVDLVLTLFRALDRVRFLAQLGAERLRLVLLPLLEERADALRRVPVLVAKGADLGLELLPLVVERDERVEIDVCVAVAEPARSLSPGWR